MIKLRAADGFSLLEVLVAGLFLAVGLMGVLRYQQQFSAMRHYYSQQYQADQIAFQLLDSYPDSPHYLQPPGWQYQLTVQPLARGAKCVKVVISVNGLIVSEQWRWFAG